MPHLTLILISPAPAAPMQSVERVRALPGRGLEGDRYYTGTGTFAPQPMKPDFELTLIEQEKIEAFACDAELPFTAFLARRNLVTTGVDLNALVGREFTIGEVRVRGIRLCEPCNHLAKISWPETLRGLVHKGGLRAQVLTEGSLRRGDEIRLPESPGA
jgi:MOSC domain-containing protein YiiM